jgi:hypothetical protein
LLLALLVESVLLGMVRFGRWIMGGPWASDAAAGSHHRH